MSNTSYIWNHTQQITIHCTWTQGSVKKVHNFIYVGTFFDALHYCYENVLGSKFPDFNMEIKEVKVI